MLVHTIVTVVRKVFHKTEYINYWEYAPLEMYFDRDHHEDPTPCVPERKR
jgi:hypothetical protein